jgi:hypothetical protein
MGADISLYNAVGQKTPVKNKLLLYALVNNVGGFFFFTMLMCSITMVIVIRDTSIS